MSTDEKREMFQHSAGQKIRLVEKICREEEKRRANEKIVLVERINIEKPEEGPVKCEGEKRNDPGEKIILVEKIDKQNAEENISFHEEVDEKIVLVSPIIPENSDYFNGQREIDNQEKSENFDKRNRKIGINQSQSMVSQINTSTEDDECFCNFVIYILRRIQEIAEEDGKNNTKIFFEVRIVTRDGECYETLVPGSEIYHLGWITKCSGGAAYIAENRKARETVVKAIRAMISSGDMEKEIRYRQNGWKYLNGNWSYVISSGVIGARMKGIYGDSNYWFAYDDFQVGTKKNFIDAMGMARICREKNVGIPLLLYAHMGVLEKLFELAGVPFKGIMALIGPTNSRKTSMALCMTKVFNRHEISTPEISFDSTVGGIEKETSFHPDSVILIDDFHPALCKNKQNELEAKLEFLVRRYGDRVVKKRMTDFTSGQDAGKYPVHGLALITGEDIAGVQSSLTRTLCLQLTRQTVQNQILSYYQKYPEVLPTHLYGFIDFVTKNFKKFVEIIGRRTKQLRSEKKYEIPRFSEYFAQFMVVAEILAEYARDFHFWDDNEIAEWIKDCEESMEFVIFTNLKGVKAVDYAVMLMQALQETILIQGVEKLNRIDTTMKPVHLIIADEEHYFVKADYLLEITRKYWKRMGIELPFANIRQIGMFLESNGLIETRYEGKELRRTLPLPGQKQRYFYIKKMKMSEILSSIEI